MKAGDVIPGRRPALSIEWKVSFIVHQWRLNATVRRGMSSDS
jgi:hypothetical protein